MNKKILGLMIVLAIVAIGPAAALDETVVIGDIDFNVPDGFMEIANNATINEKEVINSISYVVNGKIFEKGDDVVAINVSDYGEFDIANDFVKQNPGKTDDINGIDGYLKKDGNITTFSYVLDNELVTVSVSNDNLLSDFIRV